MNEVRLLVVDDSADLRDLVTIILDRPDVGWRVVDSAANGEEAVVAAQRCQPDVVLLDVSMPVMDGLEALPLIRAAAPQAVVLMLSAFPSDKLEQSARAAGAHGYIEKTDLVSELMPRIRESLTNGPVEETATNDRETDEQELATRPLAAPHEPGPD